MSCQKCGGEHSTMAHDDADEQPRRMAAGYVAGIEYSKSYAATMPNNCAVIERTADGVNVGPCTFYLKNGTTCPRHGKVKAT